MAKLAAYIYYQDTMCKLERRLKSFNKFLKITILEIWVFLKRSVLKSKEVL